MSGHSQQRVRNNCCSTWSALRRSPRSRQEHSRVPFYQVKSSTSRAFHVLGCMLVALPFQKACLQNIKMKQQPQQIANPNS